MAAPDLPAVADFADSLSDQISNDENASVFQITGRAWSGKSSVLEMLEERLEGGRVVVRAGPPSGANDAGPLAIMQLAAGLKSAGAVNGATRELRDREILLEDKLAAVRRWLEESGAIVLLDEPERWAARSDTTGHFAERAHLVADSLLRDANVTRVFTGKAPLGIRRDIRRELPNAPIGRAFLSDTTQWGPLVETAHQLAALPEADELTPLELRLLVAATAIGAKEAAAIGMSRRDRADALFAFLDQSREWSNLGDAWRRVATIRSVFSHDLFDRFAGVLGQEQRNVLQHCLLFRSGESWSMHETLRADARRHRGTRDDPHFSSLLADHYDRATDELDSKGSPSALLTLMEATYYAATAIRRDIVDRRGCFVEQLDLLGKMLSLERRDYKAAVEVFELALQLDPEDDYAAHYIGFNLDRLGRDPKRAEETYRLAIALNDEHAWWRSRLISFLAERGQLSQARREWDGALDSVLPPDGTSDVSLYETLHGWVAATLLRIGELQFARSVLSAVPEIVFERSPMLKELRNRFRAFEIADVDGAYVPAQYLRDGWWKAPILLQRRIGQDDRLLLRRWLAGRIEALDDRFVEMRVADLRLDGGSPRFARTRVATSDFDSWTRDAVAADLKPGRFVEIGLYSADDGSDAMRLMRIHLEEPVGDDAPGAVGPLDRWHQELAGTLT